jgi:rubredoxin
MRPKYDHVPPRITIVDPLSPDDPWCPGCGESDPAQFTRVRGRDAAREWFCRQCGKKSPVATGEWRNPAPILEDRRR